MYEVAGEKQGVSNILTGEWTGGMNPQDASRNANQSLLVNSSEIFGGLDFTARNLDAWSSKRPQEWRPESIDFDQTCEQGRGQREGVATMRSIIAIRVLEARMPAGKDLCSRRDGRMLVDVRTRAVATSV